MSVITQFLLIKTKGNNDIIDLTSNINEFVKEHDIKESILSVSVVGSTVSIISMEYEPGLINDFKEVLNKLFPQNVLYEHNKKWGDDNGYSHIRASFLGNSKSFTVYNGELQLGTWQQIVLIDFDTKERVRKVVLQILY